MTKEKPVLQVTFGLLHEQFKWFLGYIFFSSVATLIVTTIISYFTDDFIVQATDFDLHYILYAHCWYSLCLCLSTLFC